jgi:hypothetical protein
MQIWTIKDGKVYIISYNTDPSKYNYYLILVRSMIESFRIESKSHLDEINSAGIRVGIMPISIAVNPNNNKVYATNLLMVDTHLTHGPLVQRIVVVIP